MTTFRFDETVPLPPGAIITAALGTASPVYTGKEIGKAVKLGADSTYVVCVDNDAIEGMITSVEPGTVNNGFAHGGVQRWIPGLTRLTVRNASATPLAINDFVRAAAQAAIGTENADGVPLVEPGLGSERMAWRVVSRLGGTGAQDTKVLVEAVVPIIDAV